VLPDYRRQAQGYDNTRAANPAVVQALLDAFAAAPGRRFADIGGGTGNYSQALRDLGWEPLVIDASEAMLTRARAKGLFERLERDDPEGFHGGLRRLERDLAAGRWPGEASRTTVVAWDKPA
jgi:predicted TPR repeat methyltransferase